MAENLNYGVMVLGSAEQDSDTTPEKYCADDVADNCDIYGGLYQWAEMMDLSYACNSLDTCVVEAQHQGICPNGWHVPSDDDWSDLITFANANDTPSCPEDINGNTTFCWGYAFKSKEPGSWKSGPGNDLFSFNLQAGGARYHEDYLDSGSYFGHTLESTGEFGVIVWYFHSERSTPDQGYTTAFTSDSNTAGSQNQPKTYGLSLRCIED